MEIFFQILESGEGIAEVFEEADGQDDVEAGGLGVGGQSQFAALAQVARVAGVVGVESHDVTALFVEGLRDVAVGGADDEDAFAGADEVKQFGGGGLGVVSLKDTVFRGRRRHGVVALVRLPCHGEHIRIILC
jgi:hypothetical protein